MTTTTKKLYRIDKHLKLFGLDSGKQTIYGLVSVDTGQTYIGQTPTTRYRNRVREHRTQLHRRVHTNKILQEVYERSTIVAYIIAQTDSKEVADAVEQFCILYQREGMGMGLNIRDNRLGMQTLDVKLLQSNKQALQDVSKMLQNGTAK